MTLLLLDLFEYADRGRSRLNYSLDAPLNSRLRLSDIFEVFCYINPDLGLYKLCLGSVPT